MQTVKLTGDSCRDTCEVSQLSEDCLFSDDAGELQSVWLVQSCSCGLMGTGSFMSFSVVFVPAFPVFECLHV